jgi:hypothetical protein
MASQYVVLEAGEKENTVRVVVHTDVPASGTNYVGTQWQAAVAGYRNGQPSVVPATILPVDRQADLDAGLFHEWSFTMEYDANLPDAEKETALEAEITARESIEQSAMQARLRFWGLTGNVV